MRRPLTSFLAGMFALGFTGAGLADELPSGVASGDTTATSTVLWALAGTTGQVAFEVSTDPNFSSVFFSTGVAVSDVLVPARTPVNGLDPGVRYYFRATDAGGDSSKGTFVTTGSAPHPTGVRIGVSGDWRGELAPYPSVKNVPGRELDLWIALGDTIYADVASPALPSGQAMTLGEFRIKHREVLSDHLGLNTLADVRSSSSLIGMIDDHEVTNDFAGGAHPSSDPRFAPFPGNYINETQFYLNGLTAFHDYHAINTEIYGTTGDPRTEAKLKLYRARQYGRDAAVFVADARSFRDEELEGVVNPLDPQQVAAFLIASFDPLRTMLGEAQLQDLTADLLAAQQAGVTWKFVCVPEPIQNLGVVAAPDRFEGYAAERTILLKFIDDHDIENVVFVAADIHGTLVNDLTYQLGPGQPQVPVLSFEVTTGAVAYDAPFGPTIILIANALGIPGVPTVPQYLALPPAAQELVITTIINSQITPLGYNPLGLDGSPISATLLEGGYTATNSYGWTEFDVHPVTQELTVTTWGVPWYSEDQLTTNPASVLALEPVVYSRFVVEPQAGSFCYADCDNSGAVDFFDFLCFINAFNAGEAYADCDQSGGLEFSDFTCFQNAVATGCP